MARYTMNIGVHRKFMCHLVYGINDEYTATVTRGDMYLNHSIMA
jgi:hypothetical protein